MTTLTIPKELAQKGDLVLIPMKDYEQFSYWKKSIKPFKTYIPTNAEKRELRSAREDYKKGKFITVNELRHKLAVKSQG